MVELRMRRVLVAVMMAWLLSGCGLVDPKGKTVSSYDLKLEQYDFDNLKKRGGVASEIEILGDIKEVETRRKLAHSDGRVKYEFSTREIRFTSNGKKISGMINYYPEKSSLSKVVIMVRGYAEKEGYYPGYGSWKVADKLAEAGYTTISLDFLGFGNSDKESEDVLEARFEKVESVLDLIESVKQLPWVDKNKIGIWAHSNGGQIALSVLEITGANYPTVLWAPMTQRFPDSVLATIEEDSPVKAVIEEFGKHYDVRRYAFENYYQWIGAPILIQQGTADSQVKVGWQEEVASKLRSLGKMVELIIYPGSDHNLNKNWEEAVRKDIEWWGKIWER